MQHVHKINIKCNTRIMRLHKSAEDSTALTTVLVLEGQYKQ